MDKEGTVHVVYLDFTNTFDVISHHVLVAKLLIYGMDKETSGWRT